MDVGYNAFSGKSCSLSAGRLVSADAIDLGKFPQRRDRPRECAISAGDCSAGYSHETNVAAVKAFVPRASSREQWTHHVPVLPPAFDRSTIGSRLFGKVPVCSKQVPLCRKQVPVRRGRVRDGTKQVPVCSERVQLRRKIVPLCFEQARLRRKQVLVWFEPVLGCCKKVPFRCKRQSVYFKEWSVCRKAVSVSPWHGSESGQKSRFH